MNCIGRNALLSASIHSAPCLHLRHSIFLNSTQLTVFMLSSDLCVCCFSHPLLPWCVFSPCTVCPRICLYSCWQIFHLTFQFVDNLFLYKNFFLLPCKYAVFVYFLLVPRKRILHEERGSYV